MLRLEGRLTLLTADDFALVVTTGPTTPALTLPVCRLWPSLLLPPDAPAAAASLDYPSFKRHAARLLQDCAATGVAVRMDVLVESLSGDWLRRHFPRHFLPLLESQAQPPGLQMYAGTRSNPSQLFQLNLHRLKEFWGRGIH